MADRPILFSAPMVRAILDGRKTQTRRVVNGCVEVPGPYTHDAWQRGELPRCPYGQPGDLLWVRETWCRAADPITSKLTGGYHYRADGEEVISDDGDGYAEVNKDGTFKSPWSPSIYMPREASRLSLRVLDVRVQRLQEISEDDALAEGVKATDAAIVFEQGAGRRRDMEMSARGAFACLWDSINAKRAPWSSDPWVWAITFERGEEASRG